MKNLKGEYKKGWQKTNYFKVLVTIWDNNYGEKLQITHGIIWNL